MKIGAVTTKPDITPEQERHILKARLHDYDRADIAVLRAKLNGRWRDQFPEAAKEISEVFEPLERDAEYTKQNDEAPDEQWFNNRYHVTVRRTVPDKCFGTGRLMIVLGISAHDGTARHDWRDFQAIKNQIAGDECEAFELYPADSRLLDPSNYYIIWCFPFLKRLRLGMEARRVFEADVSWAPQRAFAVK